MDELYTFLDTGNTFIAGQGQGGPMIERSLAWLRSTLASLSIPVED